jgi:hypothetical protein
MPAFFDRFMERPDVQSALGARGRGPFGGDVSTTGQGGYAAAPEATVARTPQPGAGASPYGPSPIRPENQRNRWLARRMAGQQMLMPGGRMR